MPSRVELEYRKTPAVVQHAVDTGSASIAFSVTPPESRPELERRLRFRLPAILEKGGDYYTVERIQTGSHPFFLAKYLWLVHAVGAFVGILLVFWAFQLPGEGP